MPPFVIPPLVKFALGVLGGAVVIHWAIREVRRFNAELERVKASSTIDPAALPTLRRDPQTDEWRPG